MFAPDKSGVRRERAVPRVLRDAAPLLPAAPAVGPRVGTAELARSGWKSPGLGQLSPAASPGIPWKGSSKHPRGLPGAPPGRSPVPPVPPVPARSASLGVPAASPPLSHEVPPAGADPSPRGSHPGMCRDSRSGRGHTCTDQVSLQGTSATPGCPLRECHSSRPDTQPLPA